MSFIHPPPSIAISVFWSVTLLPHLMRVIWCMSAVDEEVVTCGSDKSMKHEVKASPKDCYLEVGPGGTPSLLVITNRPEPGFLFIGL